MNNKLLKAAAIAVCIAMICSLTACSKGGADAGDAPSVPPVQIEAEGSIASTARGVYLEEDLSESYDSSSATAITLNRDSAAVSGLGASVSGSVVTISNAGVYVVSGSLTNGQIVIDADKNDNVRLILNGADISCESSAPIYAKKCEKLTVTLAGGSENTLTGGESYTFADGRDEPDGALFSKGGLVINGSGALSVTANCLDGIVSKDTLVITGGNITVTAADDAIRGKDFVSILDGSFTLTSGGDAIKSTNADDASLGTVIIDGGSFSIISEGDGIQAETSLTITDGDFEITTGGGSVITEARSGGRFAGGFGSGQRPGFTTSDAASSTEPPALPEGEAGFTPPDGTQETPPEMPRDGMGGRDQMPQDGGMPQRGGRPDMSLAQGGGTAQRGSSTATDNSISTKGLKAGTTLEITDGSFTLNCLDDAIHSNGDVTVSGGNFSITTDDDGVHADNTLTIDGGVIDITRSYEGLEGTEVIINGGEIALTAFDDGVNSAGGSDGETSADSFRGHMGGSSDCNITVAGGRLYVNAFGDGLDANGSIVQSGGAIVVSGPQNGGNGALDYDGSYDISGGTLISAGSSGMAQNTSSSSSQPALAVIFTESKAAGSVINLTDASGKLIVSYSPEKTCQHFVFSSSELKAGESYTLYAGEAGSESRANGVADAVSDLGKQLCTVTLSTESSLTFISDDGSERQGGGMGGMGR